MSKKYKHKPPHNGDPLLLIENQALRTKFEALSAEHETLQTALRLLTSEDKDTLIAAIKQIKEPQYYVTTQHGISLNPHQHQMVYATGATSTSIHNSGIIGSNGNGTV